MFTKCRPPIISIKSKNIIPNSAPFYIDTGAEISLVKEKIVEGDVVINTNISIEIHGITSGEHSTLGVVTLDINGLPCQFHVVKNDINLEI